MQLIEAKQNIGKPFKCILFDKWDVIVDVNQGGEIVGEFIISPVEDCRLKQDQPEALRNQTLKLKSSFNHE